MPDIKSETIELCKQGNELAWRTLFVAAYPLSKWVASHTLFNISQQIIDEIAQETMVALATNIDKIKDEMHLKRYVKLVSKNKCIDYIRCNKEQFDDLPDDLPEEDDLWADNTVIDILHEAVDELKEPCRTIIRNRYLLNLSYKDIAKKIGIEIGQIGVRLNRCLAFLRNLLKYKRISWEDIL